MNPRSLQTTALRLGILALLALPAASRAAAPAVHGDPATVKTITDIRNVGTAMWTWYKAEVAPKRSAETHKKAEEAARSKSVDIDAIPAISREDLAKLLVPRYIAAIPEKDGWGHPYDFHLVTNDPQAVTVMGLRSAGRDGKFSGTVYEIGAFPPVDVDQDISWVDGYFARWPEGPKKTK
jgi:hypothetical protein